MTENTGAGPAGGEGPEDPGRDPAGLDPPRNLFGAGPDQDSGQGRPDASPGTEGESMMPESPTEDDDRV
jgi:hypothetical protein